MNYGQIIHNGKVTNKKTYFNASDECGTGTNISHAGKQAFHSGYRYMKFNGIFYIVEIDNVYPAFYYDTEEKITSFEDIVKYDTIVQRRKKLERVLKDETQDDI